MGILDMFKYIMMGVNADFDVKVHFFKSRFELTTYRSKLYYLTYR